MSIRAHTHTHTSVGVWYMLWLQQKLNRGEITITVRMTQALGLEWDQWDWKNGLVNGIEFHHTGCTMYMYM